MSEPWDPAKARINLRKHSVSFAEAVTVERDPRCLFMEDRLHAIGEERWILIGLSGRGRLLRVTCTYRDVRMRPITARRATKRERDEYLDRTR